MTHRSLIFSRMQLYLALPTREIEVWTQIHHIYSKIRAAQPHTDISTDPSHAHSLANGNQSWTASPETFLCTKHIQLLHSEVQAVVLQCQNWGKSSVKEEEDVIWLILWLLLLLLLLPVHVGGGHKKYLADSGSLEGKTQGNTSLQWERTEVREETMCLRGGTFP